MTANLTVAYLGPAGTFTEQAVWQFVASGALPDSIATLPVRSPAEALGAVREGQAQYAVVAIESSVDGPVTHTFDALAGGGVRIIAETDVSVAFSIMVRPGTKLEDVRTLSTHPVARPQVASWVDSNLPGVEDIPASSNAAAAAAVARGEVDAAAAPARAAEVYGLETLASGVADVAGAHTRFVLVVARDVVPPRTGNDRTSIVFTLPNTPGSLVGALTEFAARGVDLSRIESRPTRTGMGTYRFHVDLLGHLEDPPLKEALMAVHRRCEDVLFLGSWGACAGDAREQDPSWREASDWVEQLCQGIYQPDGDQQ